MPLWSFRPSASFRWNDKEAFPCIIHAEYMICAPWQLNIQSSLHTTLAPNWPTSCTKQLGTKLLGLVDKLAKILKHRTSKIFSSGNKYPKCERVREIELQLGTCGESTSRSRGATRYRFAVTSVDNEPTRTMTTKSKHVLNPIEVYVFHRLVSPLLRILTYDLQIDLKVSSSCLGLLSVFMHLAWVGVNPLSTGTPHPGDITDGRNVYYNSNYKCYINSTCLWRLKFDIILSDELWQA